MFWILSDDCLMAVDKINTFGKAVQAGNTRINVEGVENCARNGMQGNMCRCVALNNNRLFGTVDFKVV